MSYPHAYHGRLMMGHPPEYSFFHGLSPYRSCLGAGFRDGLPAVMSCHGCHIAWTWASSAFLFLASVVARAKYYLAILQALTHLAVAFSNNRPPSPSSA